MTIRLKSRIEFLVPLKYNDGKKVEEEKLFEVREIVVDLFGSCTTHPVSRDSVEGVWIDPETKRKYYDISKKFEATIDVTSNIFDILTNLKEKLKKMFKQKEIYMVCTQVIQI